MSAAAVVILVCAAVLAWVLAVYPVWLAIRARYFGRPPAKSHSEPAVTAVIPVHNGAPFLAAKLDSVLASRYPPRLLDVLVLSDGSTDGTDEIAQSYTATGRIRFERLPKAGKAAALNHALSRTSAEILLLTDVRQRLEPDCVSRLMRPFADPQVGVVSGELRIRRGETEAEHNVGMYWRYESWIRRNLGLTDSLLGATGPIYAMRRSLAHPLPPGCILDDMWLPLQAVLAGYRSVLAPDAVAWDYPTTLDSEFVRKVRTQAGLFQLLRQEPRLLLPFRYRLWPAFVSLKLGRLFMPHVLITIFLASFWLPPTLRWPLLAAQASFYGLAWVDRFVGERSTLKRFSCLASTFVTLLFAAFQAQAIFFRDPSTLWKQTRVRLTK